MPTSIPAVPPSHQDLFEANGFAHLASLGPDGEPQVHPVWYEVDGDNITVSTTKSRQKYRNLQRDQRVALSILDPENPYRYVEVRGRVARMEDDPDQRFIDQLAKKYLGQDTYPWKQPGDERVKIYIEAEKGNTMG